MAVILSSMHASSRSIPHKQGKDAITEDADASAEVARDKRESSPRNER